MKFVHEVTPPSCGALGQASEDLGSKDSSPILLLFPWMSLFVSFCFSGPQFPHLWNVNVPSSYIKRYQHSASLSEKVETLVSSFQKVKTNKEII